MSLSYTVKFPENVLVKLIEEQKVKRQITADEFVRSYSAPRGKKDSKVEIYMSDIDRLDDEIKQLELFLLEARQENHSAQVFLQRKRNSKKKNRK